MPYYISDYFNSGNNFSVQLSNAAGSFASPVTIGTRTSTFNGTVTSVIPRTTTAGTGYLIRIVSNSPLCEPDTIEGVTKGTMIQLKDVLGRQVIHAIATTNITVLNTEQLTAGNYLLILTTTDGEVMTEKVVKE